MQAEEAGLRILNYRFSQNNVSPRQEQIVVGTSNGFRIIHLESHKITTRRDKSDASSTAFQGGFCFVAPLFSTQILMLVGSSNNSRYPPTKVYVWDEYQADMKGEVRFRSEVKNVLVRREKFVVILEQITYVYTWSPLQPVDSINTTPNESGVGAISIDKDKFVLLTLDLTPGHVRVENYYLGTTQRGFMHENPITCLALHPSGTHAASASEQGTIIRVFDPVNLNVLYELRRGSTTASVSSIAFSPLATFLLVTSSRMTVHVWRIGEQPATSSLGFLANYVPKYFSYGRSLAKLYLECAVKWTSHLSVAQGPIACFTSEDTFYVANLDGNLHKCRIDVERAELIIESSFYLLENEETEVVQDGRRYTSL